jgi:hypothetical protein
MDPRAMIKKSGLTGLKRATIMPMMPMMTKPKQEVKATIEKLKKVFKAK